MEKISSILPKSARVSSVDMKEVAPVRPGTPSFGRPEGVSALRDAGIGQTAAKASKIHAERMDWKSKDLSQAAMARELSENFFKSRLGQNEINEAEPAEVSRESEMGDGLSNVPTSMNEMTVEAPKELYPRGSFIDVQA
jgi:hypothetical protein